MRKGTLSGALLGGIAAFVSQLSFADTVATQISTTTGPSLYDKIADKVWLSYWGAYRGGSLNNLAAPLNPTVEGKQDPTSPQGVESLVTAGYKVNEDLMVGAIAHFSYFPGNTPSTSQNRFQMLDPFLNITKFNVINTGGLSLTTKLWVFLPFSQDDILIQQHLATAISPVFYLNYEVPKTTLSIGLYSYLRGYIPTAGSPANALTYKIYAAPNVYYGINKWLTATLWVDLIQATRAQNTPFIAGMTNYWVDIEPGLSFAINKNISINPILNIYPANPTLAATSLQAYIMAKAF